MGLDFEKIAEEAKRYADSSHTDLFLFNAPVYDESVGQLCRIVRSLTARRPNAALILVTLGGDPHAAYTAMRTLQRHYSEVSVWLNGDCYSAGTLMVLGAHRIVMSESGRLGPLDVQILKKDEIGERLSGLTLDIALSELREQVFSTFQATLASLKHQYKAQITFKTAMEVASRLTTGLYSEVYRQIDPLKIGEDARATQIAQHYGSRLVKKSLNASQEVVQQLIEGYPAHSCVIDYEEVKEKFSVVTKPSGDEEKLLDMLGVLSVVADDSFGKPFVLALSELKQEVDSEKSDETEGPQSDDAGVPGTAPEGAPGGDSDSAAKGAATEGGTPTGIPGVEAIEPDEVGEKSPKTLRL